MDKRILSFVIIISVGLCVVSYIFVTEDNDKTEVINVSELSQLFEFENSNQLPLSLEKGPRGALPSSVSTLFSMLDNNDLIHLAEQNYSVAIAMHDLDSE